MADWWWYAGGRPMIRRFFQLRIGLSGGHEMPFWAFLLAFVALPALMIVMGVRANAAPAYDECIDAREFRTLQGGTMREVQRYVGAHGKIVKTQKRGRYVIKQYRWCGLNSQQGFYQIFYAGRPGHKMAEYIVQFDYRDPHGHQPGSEVQRSVR